MRSILQNLAEPVAVFRGLEDLRQVLLNLLLPVGPEVPQITTLRSNIQPVAYFQVLQVRHSHPRKGEHGLRKMVDISNGFIGGGSIDGNGIDADGICARRFGR